MQRHDPRAIEPSTTDDQVLKTVAGVTTWADESGGGVRTATYKIAAVEVGAGATRLYNDTGTAWTLLSVRATVETAPSGGTVVIDVHKSGTTVFTTQANRPTIAAAGTTSGKVTAIDVTSVADGDYLTIDIDTATAPAAALTVTVTLS